MHPVNAEAATTQHFMVATPIESDTLENGRRPRERSVSTTISPTQPYPQQRDRAGGQTMHHTRQLPDPESLQNFSIMLLTQQADFQNAQGHYWLGDLVPGTEAEPTGAAATDLIQKLQRQNREQIQQLEEAKKQLEAKNQKIEFLAK